MFQAAKVVRDSRENIGAPAKTDFVKIYIDEDVTAKEYDVLFRHEQAHIWLEHNKRIVKGMERKIWDTACELEIARNIYNDDDIDIIKAQFSRISGGIVPDSIPELPIGILLAEEIYEWLLNNKKEQTPRQSCDCSDHSENESREDAMRHEEALKLVESAKEKIESSQKSKIAEQNTKLNLEEIKRRKPSLVSEIDAALRRRIEREKSYRRPSRKEGDEYIEKGRITIARPPLVEIFVDRSGSFTPEKTAKAQNALDVVLKRYNSSIRHDVWYFGSGKISAKDFSGGDTPYHLIAAHLAMTKPKIAIIMTDDDQCADIKINVKTLVIPIGCNNTDFAKKTNAIEVSI